MQQTRARSEKTVNSFRPENPRLIRAALAANGEDDIHALSIGQRLLRWVIAIALMPFCVASTHTFLLPFTQERLSLTFLSNHLIFFIIGVIVMVSWHVSGVGRQKFLYLYVVGHELTHMLFIKLYRGTIIDHHFSSNGGYVVTDKSNTLIALAPYMVPFWMLCLLPFFSLSLWVPLANEWHYLMLIFTGMTWTFHFIWTMWMIPSDQPDLRENDTFFSLIVIYLANILLLSLMISLANSSMNTANFLDILLENTRFAYEWPAQQMIHWFTQSTPSI